MLSFFFQVRTEGNSYCVTGYKVLYCTYPDRTTKHNNDFRNIGVLFCYRLARSTYKLDLLFGNFGFGVLQSQKCYIMFQI